MSKLPLKIQILYGLGVSYAIVDQIFAQWILYFYLPPANSGLKPVMAPILLSCALAISRFVDMITDPMVGYMSDRVSTSWGRRIPFIGVGLVPLAIFTVLFFYPPTSSEMASFWYLAFVGSMFFVFYTIVSAPYNALVPEIGHTRAERLNLSTWQSIFRLIYSAIAMIFPGILIAYFTTSNTPSGTLNGIHKMVITLCIIVLIGGFATVFFVPEKKYSEGHASTLPFMKTVKILFKYDSLKNYMWGLLFFFIGFNNLRAVMNYYIEDIMGLDKSDITIISALLFGMSAICFYPVNKISKKYGYRKIMLISLALMIILTGCLYELGKLLPTNAGYIIFTLIGIPIAGGAFIFPPAMLSEIASKISEDVGGSVDGMCFGIQGFFLKLAFLISIITLPLILVWGHGNVFMGEIMGIEKSGIHMASLISIVFFLISGIFYWRYKD